MPPAIPLSPTRGPCDQQQVTSYSSAAYQGMEKSWNIYKYLSWNIYKNKLDFWQIESMRKIRKSLEICKASYLIIKKYLKIYTNIYKHKLDFYTFWRNMTDIFPCKLRNMMLEYWLHCIILFMYSSLFLICF